LPDARYSFNGSIQAPRQILAGGYITWVDPQTDDILQLLYLTDTPEIRDLGPASGSGLRLFVDARTNEIVERHRKREKASAAHAKRHARRLNQAKALDAAAEKRASRYK